jgi:hypothetical protein
MVPEDLMMDAMQWLDENIPPEGLPIWSWKGDPGKKSGELRKAVLRKRWNLHSESVDAIVWSRAILFLLWWSVVQSFWHVLNIWLCTVYWLFAYYFHNAMINYTYCVSRLVRSFYIMHHLCMWCSLI